jgi:hypothetical protein
MTISSRVSAYIKSQQGKRFCDECIHRGMRALTIGAAHDATRQLSKGGIVLGFARYKGICDFCAGRRLVIRALNSN